MLPMKTFGAPKRGRPAKPTEHPVGSYLRRLREKRGLTVRDLATRCGLRPTSASYISQLEAGTKGPNPGLARRLAEALHDDPRIFLAWAALSRRSDPVATARAVQVLAETIGYPESVEGQRAPEARTVRANLAWSAPAVTRRASESAPDPMPPEPGEPVAQRTEAPYQPTKDAVMYRLGPTDEPAVPAEVLPSSRSYLACRFAREVPALPAQAPATEVPRPKVLVPELAEGSDPAEDSRAGTRVVDTHRIDADSLAGIEPLVRPFAYRLSAQGARRVRDALRAGDLAIATRQFWPLEPAAPCVVRLSGHVLLARVLWNGRQLLLLPGGDDSDFIVLDAPDRTALERLLAGRIVAVVRAST